MTFLRIVAYTLLALAAGVAALYLLASWRPPAYSPPQLDQADKERVTKRFFAHVASLSHFGDSNEPHWWQLTEERANEYLASMDEIAFQQPNPRGKPRHRGDVQGMMDRAGLAEPVVRFTSGRVTVMVRSSEYGKIVSADLSFTFVEEGKLLVNLEAARIGLLPVPRFAIRDRLGQFKDQLERRLGKLQQQADDARTGGLAMSGLVDLADIFATIIAAVDSDPLPAIIKPMHVEIREIVIEDGILKLLVVPYYEQDDDDDD